MLKQNSKKIQATGNKK